MDVFGYGIAEVQDALWGITARPPRAAKLRPASEYEPCACAARARADKRQRYPAPGGGAVLPLVHESLGRHGGTAEDLVAALEAAATRRALRRGGIPDPRVRTWREGPTPPSRGLLSTGFSRRTRASQALPGEGKCRRSSSIERSARGGRLRTMYSAWHTQRQPMHRAPIVRGLTCSVAPRKSAEWRQQQRQLRRQRQLQQPNQQQQ